MWDTTAVFPVPGGAMPKTSCGPVLQEPVVKDLQRFRV